MVRGPFPRGGPERPPPGLPRYTKRPDFIGLKESMKLGMKLTRVHRVLKFKQSQWLKPYIEWNTKLRQEATNPNDVSLYKMMKNSFFAKTCEDVRKYTDVQILN